MRRSGGLRRLARALLTRKEAQASCLALGLVGSPSSTDQTARLAGSRSYHPLTRDTTSISLQADHHKLIRRKVRRQPARVDWGLVPALHSRQHMGTGNPQICA